MNNTLYLYSNQLSTFPVHKSWSRSKSGGEYACRRLSKLLSFCKSKSGPRIGSKSDSGSKYLGKSRTQSGTKSGAKLRSVSRLYILSSVKFSPLLNISIRC
jgi:hypothetical protein